ncbi:MAG: M28 family peptidase [Isosphaeraceae bacterium]
MRLKSDISFLADDAREGRSPGSAGIEAAAAYISGVFQALGLKTAPGAQGYFQPFKISGQAKLNGTPELKFSGPNGADVAASREALCAAIGTSARVTSAPVVFAGYGITAKDGAKKLDYDDYAGIDAKGKAVLVIRRQPQQANDKGPFGGRTHSEYATFRHKATNAYQHGALLLVNDAFTVKDGKDDPLVGLLQAGSDANSTIPVVMIKREVADKLLAAAGEPSLKDLESRIDADLKPQSRELKGWTAAATADIERTSIETRNVVGVLEGAGPLADETLVIGAHYDHLGHGGMMSGSLAMFSRDIHNGADDNASGTSMLLEMARRLNRRQDPLPRPGRLHAFSGEERRTAGVAALCRAPALSAQNTVAMISFDMVGRLNDKSELTVYGTGTSPGFDTLVDTLGKSQGLTIKKIAEGFGPSDQQSFYVKDIPVLFAFTGTHSDYHRPSDDTERINFAGMSRIADLGELLALDLVRRPSRPRFREGGLEGARWRRGRPGSREHLGLPRIDPRLQRGHQGREAQRGTRGQPGRRGLKKDDIIVSFGGKPIGTIYDYTDSLAPVQGGRQGRDRRQARRQGRQAPGDARRQAQPVSRRRWSCGPGLILAVAAGFCMAGCDGDRPGVVDVATAWPAEARRNLERVLSQTPGAPAVRWILLAPGDDIALLATRSAPPDVLLGGPATTYARLDRAGSLTVLESGRGWTPLRPPGTPAPDETQGSDPGSAGDLAAIPTRLASGAWEREYAALVGQAATWPPGVDWKRTIGHVEGSAIPRGAPEPDAARLVLEVLRREFHLEASPPGRDIDPDAMALAADLLEATLIEAHDELVDAAAALEQANHPLRATSWMTKPPPWPPASVALIADDMPMLETLAAQLAPEADVRAWLLRSWVAPSRTIDGVLLQEIAGAVEGRLMREPRFRAWLRAEWTAWARQRYRRVARLTEWGEPLE